MLSESARALDKINILGRHIPEKRTLRSVEKPPSSLSEYAERTLQNPTEISRMTRLSRD